jgi:hypothetical protein
MTAAQYAARKAARLCMGSAHCKFPRAPGTTRCTHCQRVRSAWFAKHDAAKVREAYYEAKVAGRCTRSGCKEPSELTLCPKHMAEQAARMAQVRRTKRYRQRMATAERRRLGARFAAGKCRHCERELVTETLCQVHRDLDAIRSEIARRARGQQPSQAKCSICRQPGHRRERCPKRLSCETNIDEYATARKEWSA